MGAALVFQRKKRSVSLLTFEHYCVQSHMFTPNYLCKSFSMAMNTSKVPILEGLEQFSRKPDELIYAHILICNRKTTTRKPIVLCCVRYIFIIMWCCVPIYYIFLEPCETHMLGIINSLVFNLYHLLAKHSRRGIHLIHRSGTLRCHLNHC